LVRAELSLRNRERRESRGSKSACLRSHGSKREAQTKRQQGKRQQAKVRKKCGPLMMLPLLKNRTKKGLSVVEEKEVRP